MSPKATSRSKPIKLVRSKQKSDTQLDEQTKKLIQGINRTEYVNFFDLEKTLDRSLYILQIAKDKLGIDGLTSSQISLVLWENFRLKATSNAVGMALMNAVKYVDRKLSRDKGPPSYIYYLMHNGEEYLKEIVKYHETLQKQGVKFTEDVIEGVKSGKTKKTLARPINKKPAVPSLSGIETIPFDTKAGGKKPSLIDFYQEKKPSSHQEKLMVYIYYITKYTGIKNVGLGHIVYAYKATKQRMPRIIYRIIINTKNRFGRVAYDSKSKCAILTNEGEEFVEYDLPKNEK
jgi:hypothetical protein